jgi:hypothetical protein
MGRRPLNGTFLEGEVVLDDETRRYAMQCVLNPAMGHPGIPKGMRRKPVKDAETILQALGLVEYERPLKEPESRVCARCGGVEKRRVGVTHGWVCQTCKLNRKRELKAKRDAAST